MVDYIKLISIDAGEFYRYELVRNLLGHFFVRRKHKCGIDNCSMMWLNSTMCGWTDSFYDAAEMSRGQAETVIGGLNLMQAAST